MSLNLRPINTGCLRCTWDAQQEIRNASPRTRTAADIAVLHRGNFDPLLRELRQPWYHSWANGQAIADMLSDRLVYHPDTTDEEPTQTQA